MAFTSGPAQLLFKNGELAAQTTAEAGYYNNDIRSVLPLAPSIHIIVELETLGVGLRFDRQIAETDLVTVRIQANGQTHSLEQIAAYQETLDWGIPNGEELRVYAMRKPAYDLYGDPVVIEKATADIFLQETISGDLYFTYSKEIDETR